MKRPNSNEMVAGISENLGMKIAVADWTAKNKLTEKTKKQHKWKKKKKEKNGTERREHRTGNINKSQVNV